MSPVSSSPPSELPLESTFDPPPMFTHFPLPKASKPRLKLPRMSATAARKPLKSASALIGPTSTLAFAETPKSASMINPAEPCTFSTASVMGPQTPIWAMISFLAMRSPMRDPHAPSNGAMNPCSATRSTAVRSPAPWMLPAAFLSAKSREPNASTETPTSALSLRPRMAPWQAEIWALQESMASVIMPTPAETPRPPLPNVRLS
ncbi:uncharacterized protein BCR38DRAFT_445020 [Pseudomassariella vexata]|uniref:Uncharacterized protein n=1 Tax=Pseudomassariella vexata TaxID=1141098 RepID=A0A1Y2DK47_9PEZI|nr:uncharacterized protein BCR38DRAFT_445020 [Pseudomassariella vexata]ORY59603.1 hypothetical protein BCR38DRAFT_445020 [Pseudomassariella vexata]